MNFHERSLKFMSIHTFIDYHIIASQAGLKVSQTKLFCHLKMQLKPLFERTIVSRSGSRRCFLKLYNQVRLNDS